MSDVQATGYEKEEAMKARIVRNTELEVRVLLLAEEPDFGKDEEEDDD